MSARVRRARTSLRVSPRLLRQLRRDALSLNVSANTLISTAVAFYLAALRRK